MAKVSNLVGKKAPTLSVYDKQDKKVSLKELAGKKKVIYFYPKDDTPGCTIEAKEFSDALPQFKKRNAVVVGISGGNSKTKQKFCEKYKLAHLLASDTDFSTAKAWASFGKKKFMGREYEGIFRNTFLLDENDKIIEVFESVTPKGHAKEVLDYLDKQKTKASTKTASANKAKAAKKLSAKSKVAKKNTRASTISKRK